MRELPQGYRIEKVAANNKKYVNDVVDIHLKTFDGFFLTFMGKGFLRKMYAAYVPHKLSGLFVVISDEKPVGFLAYSADMSGLYKRMVKRGLISFVWYAFLAFLRRPKAFFKLFGALKKSDEAKKEEKYTRISSIGVLPSEKGKGLGGALIDSLKTDADVEGCEYILLETDAENNDKVNKFYSDNGFTLYREYTTKEGRKMNEYRFYR